MKMFAFYGLHLREYVILLALFNQCGALPKTAPPLKPDFPFAFMWNAPTELCKTRFGMDLNLTYFQFVSSTLKTATNQSISIFYTDRFGIFPYVDEETGETYSEGLPQLVDIKEHRESAEDDITFYIPVDQPGLAVLDFEEWRPQWVRNWGSKDIYRKISIETIMQKNILLTEDEAEVIAKRVFEGGAKRYFLRSLKLGKTLRPKRLWGYYLYPDCYNYEYNQDLTQYSGECPEIEKERNDELLWLWQESTALYPSIYLELILKDTREAALYVRHRIQEAMRVSMLPNKNYSIPIYAYIRPVYKDSDEDYLSKLPECFHDNRCNVWSVVSCHCAVAGGANVVIFQLDLVNTIGEAAALGAAGVVSWGDMNVTESKVSCSAVRRYLEKTMNPYIVNVTEASRLCSTALCQGKGRCIRKNWDSEDYLHLDPHRYMIKWSRNELSVKGRLSQDDIDWFEERFDCLCYSEGPCYSPITLNKVSDFVSGKAVHLYPEGSVFLPFIAFMYFLSEQA